MNPIWKREFLARWRDRRSYLLLFALAAVLSGVAYWSYCQALANPPLNTNVFPPVPIVESLTTRSSRLGHALFRALSIGNVLLWFVLAPLLTATGVARERERGLLELLQLSPMRPISQIAARALSALSFLAVLQLITIPIYFVAFSFGGVSEEEIGRVWQVVGATAFCGVGLGMALSAQSPRPSSALFGAVALVVLWSLTAFIGSNSSVWTWYLGTGTWAFYTSTALGYSHPLTLVWNICEPNAPSLFGIVPFWGVLPIQTALPLSLLGWWSVGTLCLIKATRDVRRSLPPLGWAQRNALIQRWKRSREERLKRQRASWRQKVSVERALLADLPFERLIRFKNPLLNREVKGRFRLRQASPLVWLGRFVLFLCGASVWVIIVMSGFVDVMGRMSAVPLVLWAEWIFGAALVGSFAASAFSREHEAGTWEGIQLSLFSAGEITRSKWASSLLAFGILSCPLWGLLFPLLPWGSWVGVPFRWMAIGVLVVVASLSWISALGIWISQRAKSTASAMCWTLGTLLGLFLGLWIAESSLQVPQRLASWYYEGDAAFMSSNSYYDMQSPRYLSLYRKETGRQVNVRMFTSASTPGNIVTSADLQEWTRYSQWFYDHRNQLYRFAQTVDAWNPIVVINALQDRGRSISRYGTVASNEEEERRVLGMSLIHIFLASLGAAGLLWNVKGRLEHQKE